jgi:hypothetical protein
VRKGFTGSAARAGADPPASAAIKTRGTTRRARSIEVTILSPSGQARRIHGEICFERPALATASPGGLKKV